MADYQIRLATTEQDRTAAYRLRYALYVEAQGLFQDMADHERRWLHDEMDEHADITIATVGDEVVGTGRMVAGGEERFDQETRTTFDIDAFVDTLDEASIGVCSRLLVLPEYRGGPLTVQLIHHMWELAVERGLELLLGECEPHLVNTWIRLGFRPYGLCEHPVNGTLVRIAFVLGDREHAESIGSPLAPALRHYQDRGAGLPQRLREMLLERQEVVSQAEGTTRFWTTVEQALPRTELARRLGELEDEELEILLDQGHALDCQPDAMLIRKGHVSRTLYILLAGTLVVRDEGRTIVEIEEPGEILGEVAFFTGGERMSDVLAGSHGARVLALSERSLRRLVQTQGTTTAKFLMAMTRGLCTKLRQRAVRPSDVATQIGLVPLER